MISITKSLGAVICNNLNEGILDTINSKLVNSKFGKAVDNINDRIDKSLQKTAPGRVYMGLENKTTDLVNKASNKLSNLNDQLHRRNFKIRR